MATSYDAHPNKMTLQEIEAGGYQYDYVEGPPDNLTCPICLYPCREPQILGCCGAKFCYSCISKEEAAGRPCPLCRERGFRMLIHKEHERKILALKVNCKYKAEGCPWVGELRRIEHPHLSNDCHYVPTACKYQCGYTCKRSDILYHEEEVCEQRPTEIKLLKKVEALERESKNQQNVIEQQAKLIEDQCVALEGFIAQNKEDLETRVTAIEGHMKASVTQLQGEVAEFKKEEKEDLKGLRETLEKKREEVVTRTKEKMKNTMETRLKEVQDKITHEIVNEKQWNLKEEIQILNNELLAFKNEQKKHNEAQAAEITNAIQENGENKISSMNDDIKLLRKELSSKSDEHESKLKRDVKATEDRINAIDMQFGKFLVYYYIFLLNPLLHRTNDEDVSWF